MWRVALLLAAAAGLVGLANCSKPTVQMEPFVPPEAKDYSRPLPPGALALRKIGPEQYPDFGAGFQHRVGLAEAVEHSIAYLSKPSSERYFPYGDIDHARALASLRRFREVLDEVDSPQALDHAIRKEFDVYQSVGCDDRGTVFFTGYYCPIFDGRRERDSRFRYPLYASPPDLARDAEGQTTGRRAPQGDVEGPYPTRRAIEEGRLLDGLELAWLKDPFEAYVVTVQGSCKLRLEDGSLCELGYAGDNGREYTPVAAAMIADGVIRREELSLQTLLAYFSTHPDRVYHYCWKNERYVFFKPAPGGPFGCLGTPVTPYRSIATDKEVYPRACIAFVSCSLPIAYGGEVRQVRCGMFALDQDRGGAIRAAGRCDVFMGVGEEAEALAGRTAAEGALYYVFLKQ